MFTSKMTEAKPEGRQPWPAGVCGCRPVGRRKKNQALSLRYVHHRASLAVSAGIRLHPFGLWARSILKRHQENSSIDFFLCVFFRIFFLSPCPHFAKIFWAQQQQGVLPVRSRFNSATQTVAGQNRLLQVEVGEKQAHKQKPKKKKFTTTFILTLLPSLLCNRSAVCQEFSFCFFSSIREADASFTTDGDLEVEIKGRLGVFSSWRLCFRLLWSMLEVRRRFVTAFLFPRQLFVIKTFNGNKSGLGFLSLIKKKKNKYKLECGTNFYRNFQSRRLNFYAF